MTLHPDDAVNAYGTAEAHPPPVAQKRPSAIEPARVMVLDEAEQDTLADALDVLSADRADSDPVVKRLEERLEYGETYQNPTDELVRRTFRKRRLEAEIRKENARIAELDAQLVEEWAEVGRSKDGHEATGATLSLSRRVYAKLDVDTSGLPSDAAQSIRSQHKAMVGEMLSQLPGLAGLVRSDFNLQTLSAIFAERIRDYDEEQRMLPEHERVPRDVQEFLPDELRGLLVLDATPHVQVRA